MSRHRGEGGEIETKKKKKEGKEKKKKKPNQTTKEKKRKKQPNNPQGVKLRRGGAGSGDAKLYNQFFFGVDADL